MKFVHYIFILFLSVFAVSLPAQNSPTCDFVLLFKPGRPGALIPAEIKMTWTGSNILEGYLDLQFFEGKKKLGHLKTEEFIVTGSNFKRTIMLPAMTVSKRSSKPIVKISFISDKKTYNLGSKPIILPYKKQRNMTVAVVTSTLGGVNGHGNLLNRLKFELFSTFPQNVIKKRLLTRIANLPVEEMPVNPLKYCAFDIIVLPEAEFKLLKKRQLAALKRWLTGGGSLLLILGVDSDYSPKDSEFLKGLVKESYLTKKQKLYLSPDAKVPFPKNMLIKKPCVLLKPGLGRLAIVNNAFSKVNPRTAWWRKTVCFLWNINTKRTKDILRYGQWYKSRDKMLPNEIKELAFAPIHIGDQLVSILLKSNQSKMIPFALLLTILILYLAAICPGEYYLLGKLKLRRYSFVFFPAISILFGLIIIGIAQLFLGKQSKNKSLTITDLGRNGRVLRKSVFELIYKTEKLSSERNFRQVIFSPFDYRQFHKLQRKVKSHPQKITYNGHMTGSYKVEQEYLQWKPQLNRIFSFPETEDNSLNWEQFNPFTKEGIKDIRRSFIGKKNFAGEVFVFSNRSDNPYQNWICQSIFRNYPGNVRTVSKHALCELCFRNPFIGYFSLVSKISPHGGGNFEDLSMFDFHNLNEALLVVVRKSDKGYQIYRKQYFYHNKVK